jgi:outer membrane protein insertion porin family
MAARTDLGTYLYVLLTTTFVGIGLFREPDTTHPAASPADDAKVQFIGNARISSRQLLAAIDEYPLFDAAGLIDQAALERDLLSISALYWDRGHALVKVGEPVIPPSRDAVAIPIEEGPVFRMGSVTVTGELIGSARANLAMIRIRPGALFSRSTIARDREALSDFYQDQGYAHVNVLPLTKVDLDRKTIGLTLEITRGKRASFERIDIVGNSKTSTETIRSTMGIAEGAPFTNKDLVQGKRRLEALGLDDIVLVTQHGSSDELVVLTIEVHE